MPPLGCEEVVLEVEAAVSDRVVVHVWGPPQAIVGFDERVCGDRDRGEQTVFHVQPSEFLDGSRMCLRCGSIFWPAKLKCRFRT